MANLHGNVIMKRLLLIGNVVDLLSQMSAREYLEYKKSTLRPVHYKHMDIVLHRFNL